MTTTTTKTNVTWNALNGFDLDKCSLNFVAKYGYHIPYYDDGFGKLYIYRTTIGIIGIVRASTWEDALSCVYDELLPPISDDEARELLSTMGENDDLPEGYQYQDNSTGTGIVEIDLNGESLDLLTPGIIESHEIQVIVMFE